MYFGRTEITFQKLGNKSHFHVKTILVIVERAEWILADSFLVFFPFCNVQCKPRGTGTARKNSKKIVNSHLYFYLTKAVGVRKNVKMH